MRLRPSLFTLFFLIFLSSCQNTEEDKQQGSGEQQTKKITYTVSAHDPELVNTDGTYVYLHDSLSGEVIAQAQVDANQQVHFEVPRAQITATVTVASLKPYHYIDATLVSTFVDLPLDYLFLPLDGKPVQSYSERKDCIWKTINYQLVNLPENTASLLANGNSVITAADLIYETTGQSMDTVSAHQQLTDSASWKNIFCDRGDDVVPRVDSVFEAIDEEGNKLSYGFIQLDDIEDEATYEVDMSLQHEELTINFTDFIAPTIFNISASGSAYSMELELPENGHLSLLLPALITDGIWMAGISKISAESQRHEYSSSYIIKSLNELANIKWQKHIIEDLAYNPQLRELSWGSNFDESDFTQIGIRDGNISWSVTVPNPLDSFVIPQLPSEFQLVNDALDHANFDVTHALTLSTQERELDAYHRADDIPDDWLASFSARGKYSAAAEQLSGLWQIQEQKEGDYYLQFQDNKLITYDYLPEGPDGACYQYREHSSYFNGFSLSVRMDRFDNSFSAKLESNNAEQVTMTVQVRANLSNHYKKAFDETIAFQFNKSTKEPGDLSPICNSQPLSFEIEQPSLGHFVIRKQGDPLISPFAPFFRDMPKQMQKINVMGSGINPDLNLVIVYAEDEEVFNYGTFIEIENTSTILYHCGFSSADLNLVDDELQVIDSDYNLEVFMPFFNDYDEYCIAPQAKAYLFSYLSTLDYPASNTIEVMDYGYYSLTPKLSNVQMQDVSVEINNTDSYQAQTALKIGNIMGGQLLDKLAPVLMFDAYGIPFKQGVFYRDNKQNNLVTGYIDWGLVSRIEVFVPYSE